ncbi:hypothetical protein J6TS7_32480 [Paenibacillus dendritiformis]|nr:A24 family peptidase [Paenibacillus dendritiformis]GIO79638.1 hypothetical protein J6TS7_32480 [Paenibacillus dendritiformis]
MRNLDLDCYIILLMSVVLVYFSITDILYRRIPNRWTHPLFIVLVLYRLIAGPMEYFIGLLPAIVFLILFFIRSEWIGAGDIKLLAIIGLCVEAIMVISIIFWMCLSVMLFTGMMKVFKKKNFTTLPLAPFVALGWLVTVLIF